MPTYSSSSHPAGGQVRPQPGDAAPERVIPFPAVTRSIDAQDQVEAIDKPAARSRRDAERSANRPRRARRRRQETPWLQRNALSVVAVSVLVALLGLGFGLLQMINRPEPAPALLAFGPPESAAVTSTAAEAPVSVAGVQVGPPAGQGLAPATSSGLTSREITMAVRTIDPNYTVSAGDTLGQIATRFNTSVERIQALNNLADPRALRIGTRLVIPPPL